MQKMVVVSALMLLMSSCGVISDRSGEYMQADSGQALHIPEWLEAGKIQPLYPIPEIENNRKLTAEFVVPEPPDATVVLEAEPYLIEQLNEKVWLKLYTAPGKVWPLLDFFWREHDIKLVRQNIAEGRMLTQVVTPTKFKVLVSELEMSESQPLTRGDVAFQMKLEQGVRRNTAELHIKTIQNIEGMKNTRQKENSLAIEQAVLSSIGQYITSDEVQNRYSLLANDIGSESRVRMLEEQGEHYLELDLAYDRTWNEIEQALKLANVTIADLDRSAGRFYVSHYGEEELGSWFDSEEHINELLKQRNFLIQLQKQDSGTIRIDVEILNSEIEETKRHELLNILFEHIS